MKNMILAVTWYRDEAGWYVTECPVIPGCMSQGETLDVALANIKEAIEGCLEARKAEGLPLMLQLAEVEVPAQYA